MEINRGLLLAISFLVCIDVPITKYVTCILNMIFRESNPEIKTFMQKNNMTRASDLHAYFMNKTIPLLGKNSKPIVWQVCTTNYLIYPECYFTFATHQQPRTICWA